MTTMRFQYQALFPKQSAIHTVFTFMASAADILKFASIDRITRRDDKSIKGFQRPQIAAHIKEIRQYLSNDNAILPNSIVVAFISGITVERDNNGSGIITIHIADRPVGHIVDGQQRLMALSELKQKDFEVFITGLICPNEEELRKQFILINNTKPLPKSLIYELLPTVRELPERLSSRTIAAELVAKLNFEKGSSLQGIIKMHTNPMGFIQDTVVQKLIMHSLSDGVMREYMQQQEGLEKCYFLVDNFFRAVQKVFPEAWKGKNPKTSRLVHSAGIIAMGYVMEYIHSLTGATQTDEFVSGLALLQGKTSWTDGFWDFGANNRKPWNAIQFVPRDYLELSQHLIRILKQNQVN